MATKQQVKDEKVELKGQADLQKANADARRKKTVSVEIDDDVHEALEKIRVEIEKQFPGMSPPQAQLARIAILRGIKQ